MTDTTTTYALGTVVRYTPDPSRHDPAWCREGMAIADKFGYLHDTYWQGTGDAHIVNAAELASVEVLFQLGDYDEIDRYQRHSPTWETYDPDDRRVITSQHRLQRRWFIRKGAKPDLATQIANAEDRVSDAEGDLRTAERNLKWRRDELAALHARQDGGA
jgi:hypothetical protein